MANQQVAGGPVLLVVAGAACCPDQASPLPPASDYRLIVVLLCTAWLHNAWQLMLPPLTYGQGRTC